MCYDQSTLSFLNLPSMAFATDLPLSFTSDQPLKALDLFAGTGGFAYAFCLAAGCINVVELVDNNPSACCTLQYVDTSSAQYLADLLYRQYNNCHVHLQDVNDALERAVLACQGALPPGSPLNKSILGEALPPPIKPDIDVIFGGFPWYVISICV
jgi:site-specific DNA-cytosine methylase